MTYISHEIWPNDARLENVGSEISRLADRVGEFELNIEEIQKLHETYLQHVENGETHLPDEVALNFMEGIHSILCSNSRSN